MKKITESQLKDKVNSLREYLKVYENQKQLLAENPYTGADAEKFARLSPEDQAWYTKGGKKPDINDPYIANRAPNKGKLGPAPAAAQQAASVAPAAPAGVTTDDIPFDPTWGGTKAAADTRTGMEKFLPNWAGGKDAPVAANQNAKWNNDLQAAVSTQPGATQAAKVTPAAPAVDPTANDNGQRPGGVAFNQDKAAQDSRIADRMDAEANASGAGQRPGGVAFNQDKAQNPYDMFKKDDGSPAAPPGFKPPPPGVIWSEPDAGEHATKVARFKELIAKAKELRTDAQVAHAKSLGDAMEGSTRYFLNKLRLIESRQLNEVLSSEEQAEMDALSAELGQQGAENDPELSALINDYNSTKQPAQAAAVTPAGPMSNVNAAVDAMATPPAGGGPIVTTSAAPAAPAAPAGRPPVAVDPRDGAVGQALAKLGVSKKDRLDQKFVDSTLGAGKYKAGTAESNMALQAHFKKQGGQGASVTPPKPTAPAINVAAQNNRIADRRDAEAGANTVGTDPSQAASVTPAEPEQIDVPAPYNAAKDSQKANVGPASAPNQSNAETARLARQRKVTTESVGYNELQRIVSLVNYR